MCNIENMNIEYINIDQNELDKPLYRYLDFYRVVQMLQNNEIVFVRPEKWEDPFETYVINSQIIYDDGGKLIHSLNGVIHGICWTKNYISDALWRIYSPHKMAVRIKTTPRLLIESIESSLNKYDRSTFFIGKVEYKSQKQIIKNAKDIASKIGGSNSDKITAKSLLLKRKSFSHEQEVRTIIFDRHSKAKNGILKLKIDAHKLIQSVLVDSRAPDEMLNVYSTYLKKELNFKGKVDKSVLYKNLDKLIINKK